MTFFLFCFRYSEDGDIMKQSIKVVLFSCLVGTIFAGLFFLTVKNKAEAKTVPSLYAFQVGVFKNQENAVNTTKNYAYAQIIQEEELYRVYIGLTVDNRDFLQNYFDNLGYNYYIKEIQVEEAVVENIKKYDALFLQTSEESKAKVLQTMLESYASGL